MTEPTDNVADPLAAAAAAHEADVQALGDLEDDQVRYLGSLQRVPDPDTDGIECETEVVTDGST